MPARRTLPESQTSSSSAVKYYLALSDSETTTRHVQATFKLKGKRQGASGQTSPPVLAIYSVQIESAVMVVAEPLNHN